MTEDQGKKEPAKGTDAVDMNKYSEVVQERDRLKESHQNAIGRITSLEKAAEKFEGVNLEKLIANNEAYERMLDEKAEKDGDEASFQERLDNKLNAAREENQKALDKAHAERDEWKSKHDELAIIDKTMAMITPHIIDGEDAAEFFKYHVRKCIGVDEQGLFVKDAEGNPKLKDGGSERESVEDWCTAIIKRNPPLAKDKQKSGTRRAGDNSTNATAARTKTPPPGLNGRALTQWYRENPDARPPTLN
jgi:hypothetical protein